ncbi:MAG: TonB-dependent receptor [Acidobacteria bacterium]|nr:TonB-dependent receptor [Acidobacteriota bacterium]
MVRSAALAMVAAIFGAVPAVYAADLKLFGSISGNVRNASGIGQMGAVVQLYNRYDRLVQKVLTSPDGRFTFDSLTPDNYSVRVSLNSFVPALRNAIPVRAGLDSHLNIQLANLFSSIELVYTSPGQTGLLSDDWKWVLRSSTATRPVLRLTPGWRVPTPADHPGSSIFSSTSGVIKVSAGDGTSSTALGSEPDLGTAFAVATSLFGTNELRFSGNFGYASAGGTPTAGFRTSYSRANQDAFSSPEVELTVRQASLRQRAGMGFLFTPAAPVDSPVLRTMSVKVGDQLQITDDLTLQYGTMLESVVFLESLNLLSPYARLSYDLGNQGTLEVGFSSGAPAYDLISADSSIQSDLTGLAMFPRVSLRDGHARVQKNETLEAGYRVTIGSRTYAATVYQDALREAAVLVSGATLQALPDLLPDFASNSFIYNLGDYRAFGYSAAVLQSLPAGISAGLSAGAADMLTAGLSESASRPALTPERRPWAAARVSGIVPGSGTRIVTSYVWTPSGSLGASHSYLTQRWQPAMGLNVSLRQPLPTVGGMPGRLEMNAELRNLLAQGYLPFTSPDGRSLYFVQFPRAIRGGLSFIF